ncbi:MAG TPA: STT3 domain-containing protein [Candidatus Nanoarchaeia archaeon]|nr:STT3 domain-containing protein [Candidatus Nanoarchaeia archaeon]
MENLKEKLLSKSWILLLLIPLVITAVVRLEPMKLAPLDGSAQSSVNAYFKEQISLQIANQFPNLPAQERVKLADREYAKFVGENKQLITDQIKANSEGFKSRLQYTSGDSTYVYLGDIDSYYWLRMSRNIIEKGTQCDDETDGKCYDTYTVAPLKNEKPIDFYPIVIVWVYKFFKIFNKDMSLMQASFLTPLVLSLLLSIPLFLAIRKVAGNIGAVVGTTLVNVNPFVLTRSLGSDSDILNILFQAIFLWLAFEFFYAANPKMKYTWGALAGACLALYSKFWSGWWYLFDLFILAVVVKMAYIYIKKMMKKSEGGLPIKENVVSVSIFVASVFIFYTLLSGDIGAFFSMLGSQFDVLRFKHASNLNLWPNVLTTVAEFNNMSIGDIVPSFRSILRIPVFLMVLFGITLLSFKNIKNKLPLFLGVLAFDVIAYYIIVNASNPLTIFIALIPLAIGLYANLKEEGDYHPDAIFMLTMLICLVTYFTTTGIRFLFLMAIPVYVLVSIFFGKCLSLLVSTLRKNLKIHGAAFQAFSILAAIWFLMTPVQAGISAAQQYIPNVTDEWVASLEKIRDESKPDAIINSWWDFGHWFKYYADRRVTLDGSSQNNPQLHWLGKLLLTSDENTSVGILRMLDCGGNNAFDEINKVLGDIPHSIDVLNKIITVPEKEARQILKEHKLAENDIEKVIPLTHCKAPENFLITSQDMIGKAGVWAHFGSWDFKKSYINSAVDSRFEQEIIDKFKEYDVEEQITRKYIDERRGLGSQESINAWIAPWPGFITGKMQCPLTQDIAECGFSQQGGTIPVKIDFAKKEGYIQKSDGSKQNLARIGLVDNGKFEIIKSEGDAAGLGITVVKDKDAAYAVFSSPELAGSMFSRLFFFDGAGTKQFDRFYDTRSVLGERIITWKVKWVE